MWTDKGVVVISIIFGVSCISINNGRYEDVNIVIQDTVAENETLLVRIQEIFTSASQMLFQATKQQVYFGQINIILPKHWTAKPGYTEIPARSELESYITVENGKVKSPHTKRKKKKCGYPGWYIYLPKDFLLQEGKTDWGHHENVLVHEWGHFRWGLFEEYGKKKYGRFYLDEGSWNPVRCSRNVTGSVGKGTSCRRGSEQCDTTNPEQVMNAACKFCPDESQAVSNMSSIMAFNWVDEVTVFCDKENNESIPIHQRHNSKAPNKHNVKCKGRSAWEVMRDHEDFNTAPLPKDTDTTPEFTILRETDSVRVFVLDVSGSMSGRRIVLLYQTCKYIIQTKIPEDSWLGIVSFSTSASTLKSITQVTSQSVRDELIGVLPTVAGGSTCIGCGIEEALDILAANGDVLAGSEIIVISDGGNNVGVLDQSVQKAVEANVTIHTISVSQAADTRMISMATETGGFHISYLEIGTISFASAFLEILSSGATSFATESTTLVSEKIDNLLSNDVSFNFVIDNSIGLDTTVSILQSDSSAITLEGHSPSGIVYTESTSDDNQLIFTIPGTAETGQYNFIVTTGASSSFEYYVTSMPTDPEVIRVVSWITPVDYDFFSDELPVIEADVMKGRAAVLNAIVTAVIETGISKPCNVSLLDNGAVPDDGKDDGTYAGVIPRFCMVNGRIIAKVYAYAETDTSAILYAFSGAGSSDSDEDETEALPNSFQRVTVPNEILVGNYSSSLANEDITAPGSITDVSIIDISTENTQYGESRNFTITWTATGDDVNIGQAMEYELRISEDISVLRNNFTAANLLDIATANFTPKVAGETEYVRIEIDAEESYTSTAFFGVRAIDDNGNVGDVSNIISILVANGYRIKIEGGVVYSHSSEAVEESVRQEEKKKNITGLAVGLSSAAAVIIIAIIAVTVCMKKLKAKEIVEDCEFGSRTSTTKVFAIGNLSRQIVGNKRFQSSQLQTFQEREQIWAASFSPNPLFQHPRKPFDIVSQGSCNIEMLDDHNNAFVQETDENLNSDTKSIITEQMPLGNIGGTAFANHPEAESELLPGEAIVTESDDKESKFLSEFEHMPKDPLQNADELGKKSNTTTAENLKQSHTGKENKRGFKRDPREISLDGKWVTSLSVEFPALLDTDEFSNEISKMFDEVLY